MWSSPIRNSARSTSRSGGSGTTPNCPRSASSSSARRPPSRRRGWSTRSPTPISCCWRRAIRSSPSRRSWPSPGCARRWSPARHQWSVSPRSSTGRRYGGWRTGASRRSRCRVPRPASANSTAPGRRVAYWTGGWWTPRTRRRRCRASRYAILHCGCGTSRPRSRWCAPRWIFRGYGLTEDLSIRPVTGIGDVAPGADLAGLIATAAPWIEDGDVLVVTSKIVSKAEGRLVPVPVDGPQREAARDALLAQETARVVARRGRTAIVQTHHGFVMASAGIDASNVDRDRLVLLPLDPDASARVLRNALRQRYGLDVAVVVSDTMGRPWRIGLTDVALGAAGIAALRDYRGETDAYGNELMITQVAVIDELCAAAELVKGKYDQVPVAVVRGLAATGAPHGAGAAELVRDAETDLFSLGTAEARRQGRRDAAAQGDPADPADPADPPAFAGTLPALPAVRAALALVGSPRLRLLEPGARDKLADRVTGSAELVVACAAGPDPAACALAGADLQ
ncbi:MAG: coenzyme F420-0:L-glutamate ligase, partial [Micromonosporaceae bacterium]|nr:coenzyme F420-0:L-glutamate ligase [Micromonosporaceae bacterium]